MQNCITVQTCRDPHPTCKFHKLPILPSSSVGLLWQQTKADSTLSVVACRFLLPPFLLRTTTGQFYLDAVSSPKNVCHSPTSTLKPSSLQNSHKCSFHNSSCSLPEPLPAPSSLAYPHLWAQVANFAYMDAASSLKLSCVTYPTPTSSTPPLQNGHEMFHSLQHCPTVSHNFPVSSQWPADFSEHWCFSSYLDNFSFSWNLHNPEESNIYPTTLTWWWPQSQNMGTFVLQNQPPQKRNQWKLTGLHVWSQD